MDKKIDCLCSKCKNYKEDSNSKFFCDNFFEIFENIDFEKCICSKCKHHNENKYRFKFYCYNGTEEKQRES